MAQSQSNLYTSFLMIPHPSSKLNFVLINVGMVMAHKTDRQMTAPVH